MNLKDDLLDGAKKIADELGWSVHRVYREAEPARQKITGFPLFRIGSRLYARRTTLLDWLHRMETSTQQ